MMKSRKYNSQLDKTSFFSKLENYCIFRFFGASIQGKLKNGKGMLLYGYRGTKKFSIDFTDEKNFIVSSHISFFDIICLCAAIFMLVGTIMMFVCEGLLIGLLFLLFPIFFCGLPLLIYFLSWYKVDKVLKNDFACFRIR